MILIWLCCFVSIYLLLWLAFSFFGVCLLLHDRIKWRLYQGEVLYKFLDIAHRGYKWPEFVCLVSHDFVRIHKNKHKSI